MGLDMYLSASKYIGGWEHSDASEKLVFKGVLNAAGISDDVIDEGSPSLTIDVTIGYWRKANAIHKWFVDKVQGGVDECQRSYVSIDELEVLLKDCNAVMKHKGKAKELMSTQSGFFFGNTDYDEDYFEDIKHTIGIVKKALKMGKGYTFHYRSSW